MSLDIGQGSIRRSIFFFFQERKKRKTRGFENKDVNVNCHFLVILLRLLPFFATLIICLFSWYLHVYLAFTSLRKQPTFRGANTTGLPFIRVANRCLFIRWPPWLGGWEEPWVTAVSGYTRLEAIRKLDGWQNGDRSFRQRLKTFRPRNKRSATHVYTPRREGTPL